VHRFRSLQTYQTYLQLLCEQVNVFKGNDRQSRLGTECRGLEWPAALRTSRAQGGPVVPLAIEAQLKPAISPPIPSPGSHTVVANPESTNSILATVLSDITADNWCSSPEIELSVRIGIASSRRYVGIWVQRHEDIC